jgi:hypothetical protein
MSWPLSRLITLVVETRLLERRNLSTGVEHFCGQNSESLPLDLKTAKILFSMQDCIQSGAAVYFIWTKLAPERRSLAETQAAQTHSAGNCGSLQ